MSIIQRSKQELTHPCWQGHAPLRHMPQICPRCNTTVYFNEEKIAVGKHWHKHCFVCGAIVSAPADADRRRPPMPIVAAVIPFSGKVACKITFNCRNSNFKMVELSELSYYRYCRITKWKSNAAHDSAEQEGQALVLSTQQSLISRLKSGHLRKAKSSSLCQRVCQLISRNFNMSWKPLHCDRAVGWELVYRLSNALEERFLTGEAALKERCPLPQVCSHEVLLYHVFNQSSRVRREEVLQFTVVCSQ
ncbi:CSRP2 [Cordylochernes scorpioides]|uniref:CSRP2 n=1 Tax=Cordylochernes scorpioides TaxID=51811 RepID=A0ABY6LIG6_9ARAC|nr:CSRP2 [Cordylochernes scorpioides]